MKAMRSRVSSSFTSGVTSQLREQHILGSCGKGTFFISVVLEV